MLYKVQAVRTAKEIGQAKAVKELGVPRNTLYGWVRANRLGTLGLGTGSHTPGSDMTLNEEPIKLCLHSKCRPNGITKAAREARKSDDLLSSP